MEEMGLHIPCHCWAQHQQNSPPKKYSTDLPIIHTPPPPKVEEMLSVVPPPSLRTTEPRGGATLSLDDIHVAWDRERHHSARKSRDLAIQNAHQETYRLPRSRPVSNSRNFSPHGEVDLLSLPPMSRPSTGRPLTGMSYVYKDGETSRTHSAKTVNSLHPRRPISSRTSMRICKRTQSAAEGSEPEDSVSRLSRQCCEVLGPRSCTPCDRMFRQDRAGDNYEPEHPNLHASEENFTTTLCVKHRLPDLSIYQIQDKMIYGEIVRPHFRDQAARIKSAVSNEDLVRAKFHKWKKKSLSKNSFPYFSCIQDLNRKLTTGNAPKSFLPQKAQLQNGSDTGKRKVKTSFSETVMPSFVSNRNRKQEKPSYMAFYAPPLLPKVCQNVEPQFFVGSNTE